MKIRIRKYIASELRALRAKENKSMEKLAEELSISKDAISRYEKATVSINVDILEKILNHYNISFENFFANLSAYKQNVKIETKKDYNKIMPNKSKK